RTQEVSVRPKTNPREDGGWSKEACLGLGVRSNHHWLAGAGPVGTTDRQSAEPWTTLGGLRFRKGLRNDCKTSQRRRHASSWQLQGREDAFLWIGNGPGHCVGDRRCCLVEGNSASPV